MPESGQNSELKSGAHEDLLLLICPAATFFAVGRTEWVDRIHAVQFYLPFLLITAVLARPAEAIARVFPCGPALVSSTIARGQHQFLHVALTLTVKNGSRHVQLIFPHASFGAECRRNQKGKPFLVWQSCAGKPGCKELDGFGALDPDTLEVLLASAVSNRKFLTRILGKKPAPVPPWE